MANYISTIIAGHCSSDLLFLTIQVTAQGKLIKYVFVGSMYSTEKVEAKYKALLD